jgi:transposase
MQVAAAEAKAPISIRTDLCAIFVSLELSRSIWLITSLSPGAGEKMSKHSVSGGDTAGLFRRFADLQQKARGRAGRTFLSSAFKRPALTAFGSTVCWKGKESKAGWLIPHRF